MNKWIERNNYFLWILATGWLSMIVIELVFRLFSLGELGGFVFIRILCFDLVTAVLIAFLLQFFAYRQSRKLFLFLLFFFGLYALFQLGYLNYMHRFFSFQDMNYGVGRVMEFAIDFVISLKPQYFLTMVPWLVQLFLSRKLSFEAKKIKPVTLLCGALAILLLHAGSISLLFLKSNAEQLNSPYEIYQHTAYTDEAVNQLGAIRFLWRDAVNFIKGGNDGELIDDPIVDPEPVPQEPEEIDSVRHIDDTAWLTLAEAETNEKIKTIDEYLMNRTIAQKNEQTGIFKGKNLIYIMVEAFDLMAIDPDLTPTIYKMMQEGWYFENFYSPQYSCATGQSEFIGLTSLVPEPGNCTPNTYDGNDFYQSIFNLFGQQGYYASSYHNWKDQYYNRKIIHENMYSGQFLNYDDLPIQTIQGWQSDLELFQLTLPYYSEKEQFFSYIITSSMHFPYDTDSTLGNRYLDEINAVHNDYPIEVKRYLSKAMEFDKGLAYLLETLKTQGILDDTVIVLYADHHPLNMGYSNIVNYSYGDYDRTESGKLMLSPFIIYNSTLDSAVYSQPMSTVDMLPTLANLFDLNYDPRLYMGTDYFSDSQKIVFFSNGSWLIESGYYNAGKSQFELYDGYEAVDTEKLAALNTNVRNLFTISKRIYETDYFRYRHDIVFPTNTNE